MATKDETVEVRHIVAGMGNVPVSLDSGKTDLAAQALTMKEEREEKCGGTDEIYYDYAVWLMVAKDDGSTKALEDLAGLKVFGQATTQAIEAYNEENSEKTVELGYVGSTTEQVVPVIDNDTLKAWFTIGHFSGFRNFNSRPCGRGDHGRRGPRSYHGHFNSRPYGRGDSKREQLICCPLP